MFFFFKQKTAYERRISDWSSDVCSSDLSAPDSGPNTEPNTEPDATAGPTPDAAPPPAPAAELTRRYLQSSFAPDAAGGGQHLLAQSDDLGALLRAIHIPDTLVGGRIHVTGPRDGPSPSSPTSPHGLAPHSPSAVR